MSQAAELRPAERMVFFTDAVVAIAMTLLILPLMESVSEASAEQLTAGAWVSEHQDQLLGFALSFALLTAPLTRLLIKVLPWRLASAAPADTDPDR